jgi:hypothetical protein
VGAARHSLDDLPKPFDAARIIAVRLVDLRLEHRLHMPRFNTDCR